MTDKLTLMEDLESTAKKLLDTTWRERKLTLADIRQWIGQFSSKDNIEDDEQLHAMYLLTHFLYFDQSAMRQLLRAVFRDLYRTPALHAIRRANGGTLDSTFLNQEFKKVLASTRFLGVGNPSESGVHLLYYFRQENSLPKTLFLNSHEIFGSKRHGRNVSLKLRDAAIRHYVFLDDLSGSGTQAKEYLQTLVSGSFSKPRLAAQ